jgi:protoheme IX farnesyltransferase
MTTGAKLRGYLELTKPELTSLSALTALCGYYLGSQGTFDVWKFVHTAIGTLLLAGGAGALNQYIEREFDSLMKRTENRPLPSRRLAGPDALRFGITITLVGVLQLAIAVNPLTGILGAATFLAYLFIYTPLKRVSWLSTLVGAVPGALPPVMGWTAARNNLGPEALILFGILFCWQMPHFLSLAWMYKKDYARAGYQMLAVTDDGGERTSRHIFLFTTALIPISVLTTIIGATGPVYAICAVLLGLMFLGLSLAMWLVAGKEITKVNHYARRLFFASLIYLPALMAAMSLDKG